MQNGITENQHTSSEERSLGPLGWACIAVGALFFLVSLVQPLIPESWELMRGKLPRPRNGEGGMLLYSRWGFLFGAALLAIAAAMCRQFRTLMPLPAVSNELAPLASPGTNKLLPMGLMLLAAVWWWPLLQKDISQDEQHDLAHAVSGYWAQIPPKKQQSGPANAEPAIASLRWNGVSWAETLYGGLLGSNSPPQSALSRLAVEAWQWSTGRTRDVVPFSVLRLPSYIAALLLVWVLWSVTHSLAGPWAAGFVTVFIMLHPAVQEYATSARCYSMVLLVTTLGIGKLALMMRGAVRTTLWQLFLLHFYAGLVVLLFPGAALHMLALETAAALWLALTQDRAVRLGQWLGSGLAALGFMVGLSLPSLVFRVYAVRDYPFKLPFNGWWLPVHTRLMAGWAPYNRSTDGLPGLDEDAVARGGLWQFIWKEVLVQSSWESLLVFGVLPALVVAGLVRLIRARDWPGLVFAGLPLAGGALTLLFHVLVTGYQPLWWYLLFVIPGVSLTTAAGLGLWRLKLQPWAGFAKSALPAAALMLALTLTFWPSGNDGRLELRPFRRTAEMTHPRAPHLWMTSRTTLKTYRLPNPQLRRR